MNLKKVKTSIALELPWPPSINHYYRHDGQYHRISEAGHIYRRIVKAAVKKISRIKPLTQRLSVTIEAHPPDRRARDLDNILKSLLDSLEKAGVFCNDSQIDFLQVQRYPRKAGGRVNVLIETREE